MLLLDSPKKDSRLRILSFVSIALLMLAAPSVVAQKHKPKARAAAELTEQPAKAKRDRDPAIMQIIKDVSPHTLQERPVCRKGGPVTADHNGHAWRTAANRRVQYLDAPRLADLG